MRLVDPDGAVDEPPKLGVVGTRLELHQQAVTCGTTAAGNGTERSDPEWLFGRRVVPRPWGGLAWRLTFTWCILHIRIREHSAVIRGKACEQRTWYLLVSTAWKRQPLLAAGSLIHERPQQREVVGKILEYPFEIPLESNRARPHLGIRCVTPRVRLPRHDVLEGLAIGEICSAARTSPDEIVLAERQARGEFGSLDQASHAPGGGGRETKPVPAALDHLPERADRNALLILGQRMLVPLDNRHGRRQALASEADRDRHAIAHPRGRRRDWPAVHLEADAVRIVTPQEIVESRIEQRREVNADRLFEIADIEERRQRIRQPQPHRRAAFAGEPRRRDPLPWRARAGRESPHRRDMRRAAPGLGHNLLGNQETQLDTHAREANPLS